MDSLAYSDDDSSLQFLSPLINESQSPPNKNHGQNNQNFINESGNIHKTGDISSFLNPNYNPERWRMAPNPTTTTTLTPPTTTKIIRNIGNEEDLNEEDDEIILNASHVETNTRINSSRLNSNLTKREHTDTSFFIEKS